ncbi:MATE family efflux transporter [Brevibacillus panacihumi]|uniref:MATE family efflux transporter n=1 Tax=Brevibacillus panacihumi TaxID=497735 RepID=UPI003D07E472
MNWLTSAKPMLVFLIPVILSNVLQSVGQVFGMIVVGQTQGIDSVAAIAAFFPLFFFLLSSAIGIGSGSSILVAQTYGAGNIPKMKQVVGVTLAFTLIISVVVGIFGSVFAEEILRLMGTPANILEQSTKYASILFLSMPITFFYLTYTTFLRGVGDSKTPFFFLLINTILNVILLPVLIFGWLGLPAYGLYGAAYAAVVSGLLTCVLLIVFLRKKDHILKLDRQVLKHFRLDGSILKTLLRLAIPTSVSMVSLAMSEIAVITFVNDYGSNATAAYGIVNQIASYVQIPAMSVSIAISVFAAQLIGSKKHAQIGPTTKTGIMLNYLMGGVLVILVYLFSRPILGVFLDNAEAVDIAQSLILISFWSYLILGHTMALSATMRASGTVMWPTIFTIGCIWLIQVPVAYSLSHFTSLGIQGVWLAYPIAFLVNLLAQSTYYRLFWKKKALQALLD